MTMKDMDPLLHVKTTVCCVVCHTDFPKHIVSFYLSSYSSSRPTRILNLDKKNLGTPTSTYVLTGRIDKSKALLENSSMYHASRLWNTLPREIK